MSLVSGYCFFETLPLGWKNEKQPSGPIEFEAGYLVPFSINIYFEIRKKNSGQTTLLFNILSNKSSIINISYLDMSKVFCYCFMIKCDKGGVSSRVQLVLHQWWHIYNQITLKTESSISIQTQNKLAVKINRSNVV